MRSQKRSLEETKDAEDVKQELEEIKRMVDKLQVQTPTPTQSHPLILLVYQN